MKGVELMKIAKCSWRPLLNPCDLDRFNYQMDTYIGCAHYCYYCYVLQQTETDWREEILIHGDLEQRLAEELSGKYPQPVYIGYHSDPYQPCEADQKQTRRALQILSDRGFSAGFLTKSDLFLRDLDLISSMERASVSISVAFDSSRTRRLFEDNTISTKRRIKALKEAKRAGITTGALLCPVIPYITESLSLLEQLSDCADTIWVYGLSADPDNPSDIGWKNTREILTDQFPDLADQAQAAVMSRNHPFWVALRRDIDTFDPDGSLDLRIHV